jgi:hypothetical protein
MSVTLTQAMCFSLSLSRYLGTRDRKPHAMCHEQGSFGNARL